jgi:hypothetical protein
VITASVVMAQATTNQLREVAAAIALFDKQIEELSPVTERSGKSCWVHKRWACPKFLRQSFHGYAGQSIRGSAWARAFYQQQRQRGNGNHAAIRTLAFSGSESSTAVGKSASPIARRLIATLLVRRHSPLAQVLPAPELTAKELLINRKHDQRT